MQDARIVCTLDDFVDSGGRVHASRALSAAWCVRGQGLSTLRMLFPCRTSFLELTQALIDTVHILCPRVFYT